MKDEFVPNCAKGKDGNSGPYPLYKYDFVLNNYTETEVCQIQQTISKFAKKGGFGFEGKDEDKTPHLQGYIHLKIKERITSLRKHPGLERASFRKVRNEPALLAYIQKEGDFWNYGFPKKIKIIPENIFYEWQKEVKELYLQDVDDRIIYWYYGPGNIGKSAFIKYMVVEYGALFCCGGKFQDVMNLAFKTNWDSCRGIFFDIPRANQSHVSYASLECLKNGMICNMKYETGTLIFNSPHVFIFANFEPNPEDLRNLSKDRWKIKHISIDGKVEEIKMKEGFTRLSIEQLS